MHLPLGDLLDSKTGFSSHVSVSGPPRFLCCLFARVLLSRFPQLGVTHTLGFSCRVTVSGPRCRSGRLSLGETKWCWLSVGVSRFGGLGAICGIDFHVGSSARLPSYPPLSSPHSARIGQHSARNGLGKAMPRCLRGPSRLGILLGWLHGSRKQRCSSRLP